MDGKSEEAYCLYANKRTHLRLNELCGKPGWLNDFDLTLYSSHKSILF